MNTCLIKGCGKEFEQGKSKRPRLYCSDACRQKSHRDKLQLEIKVLRNNLKFTVNEKADTPYSNTPTNDLPKKIHINIKYPYETLVQMKIDCPTSEDWIPLAEIIKSSFHLTTKQIETLLKPF
ncbi:MAG: hypothetical protein ABIP51_03280 [Bacteroidia bacterium]